MNELTSFIELVTKMRMAQKSYFKNHTQTDLQRTKFLERQVDTQIEKLNRKQESIEQLGLTPSE